MRATGNPREQQAAFPVRVLPTYTGSNMNKGLRLAHKLRRKCLFRLRRPKDKAMSDQGWVQFAVMLAALGLVLVQAITG